MTMYPLDYGETAAAFAAGTRAADERKDTAGLAADPMGGAAAIPAETTQQPHISPEPADGGVT